MKPNNNQNISSNNFVARKISSGRDNQSKKVERAENPKPVQHLNNLPFKISSNQSANKNNERTNSINHLQSKSELGNESQEKINHDSFVKNPIEDNSKEPKINPLNFSDSAKNDENNSQGNSQNNFQGNSYLAKANAIEKNDFSHKNHQRHNKNRHQHSHNHENKDRLTDKEQEDFPKTHSHANREFNREFNRSGNHNSHRHDSKAKELGFFPALIDKIKKILGFKKVDKFSQRSTSQ